MDREKGGTRKESAEQQKLLWDAKGKARRPELVRTAEDLPATWRAFYDDYFLTVNTGKVAQDEIKRHALAETLKKWRQQRARKAARENHPRLFTEGGAA